MSKETVDNVNKRIDQAMAGYHFKGALILLAVASLIALIVHFFFRNSVNTDVYISVTVFPFAVLTAVIIRYLIALANKK